MCELDVFAGNFTLIDWDMYRLWLEGYTSSETVAFLKDSATALKDCDGFTDEMLVSDVNDNYRLFAMLEAAILNHTYSTDSDCFSQFQLLDSETRSSLVESYYYLDSELCREIVGRKLNSRLRKELDEICEKPSCKSVKLRSARRQYDNVKRVFKAIEEVAGDYTANIVKYFGLSRQLAEKYATLVFASSFRFEMSKKRLAYLTFENVMGVALVLMDHWIVRGETNADNEELSEPTLDKDYLSSLRDLRTLQDRDKEHRNVVSARLQQRISNRKVCLEFETNFKCLSRGIINVAVGLSHKEVKDFFVQLVEKVVEPLRLMNVAKKDVDVFLQEYKNSITESVAADNNAARMLVDNEVRFLFGRYMKTLHPAVLALYPT